MENGQITHAEDSELFNLRVRSVNPDNALELRRISALYNRVYGDQFPVHDVCSEQFWRCHIGSRYSSLVAELNGEVVAHLSVHRDRLDPTIVEIAYPVYDPRCEELLSDVLSLAWGALERQRERQGWRMLYYFAVVQRSKTQLLGSALLNTHEVAICPEYLSPIECASDNTSKRCDVLVTQRIFKNLNSHPLKLYVPERHKQFIEFLYAPLGLNRSFVGTKDARSATPLLAADYPAVERQYFRRTGVRQSFVRPSLVGDLKQFQLKFKREARERSFVYLDLTDPATPLLAAEIEDAGYRFGGVLPLFKGTDSVVYFYDSEYSPNLEELLSPRARALASYVAGNTVGSNTVEADLPKRLPQRVTKRAVTNV